MAKNRLALDLGLSMGWAVGATPHDLKHGHINLNEKSRQSKGYRFLNFEENLVGLIEKYDVREVIFESVRRHKGTDAAHAWGGWFAMLQYKCIQLGVFFTAAEVPSIKKAFTGNGNASKDDMIRECVKRGFIVGNDDEGDAVAIWAMDYEQKNKGARCERLREDAWA